MMAGFGMFAFACLRRAAPMGEKLLGREQRYLQSATEAREKQVWGNTWDWLPISRYNRIHGGFDMFDVTFSSGDIPQWRSSG